MDAIIVLSLLVGLAVAAPRWGYDSTDGVDSPEYGRRAAWPSGRHGADLQGGGVVGRDEAAFGLPMRKEAVTSNVGACRPALAGAEAA